VKVDTFSHKLSIGLAGETLTKYYLESVLKKEVTQSQGFDRAKDFLVNSVPVELKTDIMSFKTGNLCIEKISLENHAAPFILYMLPQFYVGRRGELLNWYHRAIDKRLIGDDKREGAMMPLSSPMFNENFKEVKK
jgi:hypothetical protein